MATILRRILASAERAGLEGERLLRWLSEELPASDLQSLLLEVFRRRAPARSVGELRRQYEESRFCRASDVSPERFLRFDQTALGLLPAGFIGVELSPVAPLGICAVLGDLNQNRIVSALRGTEVAADCTEALALECARERERCRRLPTSDDRPVERWTSQRLVRAQSFDRPEFRGHFRVLALCSAGRSRAERGFVLDALRTHLEFYLVLLETLSSRGYSFGDPTLLITDLSGGRLTDQLQRELIAPLAAAHTPVSIRFDQERTAGRSYYREVCFGFQLTTPAGVTLFPVIDGGFVDWSARLQNDRREQLLTSVIGTELVCAQFKVR